MTWNIGLIGTGYWSEKHLKAWQRIQNVNIAALCNRSASKLHEKAKQYKVADSDLYQSVDQLLEREDIDIIDIVTGPETHLEIVRKAASAGKHILCQKPFARSVEEAEKMVKAASDAGVRLMVTENWRWLDPFQAIKRVLDSSQLGSVRVARYLHSDYYTPRMAPDKNLPQPFFREMKNLLFYEMGAHWFDTWRFLFGTPERLYAEIQRISPFIEGDDSGIVVLAKDGFHGMLDMSWATRRLLNSRLSDDVGPNHLEQLVIEGEIATLKLYQNGDLAIISKDGDEKAIYEGLPYDHEESHFRLQSHFIHCLNSGEPFQTSGEDNLVTLRLVFGTYESAATHSVVTEFK